MLTEKNLYTCPKETIFFQMKKCLQLLLHFQIQLCMLYAAHSAIRKVIYDVIIEKRFFSFYIFVYSQPSFVTHLQRDFYIVPDHIISFFFFLVWITFDIFHMLFWQPFSVMDIQNSLKHSFDKAFLPKYKTNCYMFKSNKRSV